MSLNQWILLGIGFVIGGLVTAGIAFGWLWYYFAKDGGPYR